jgi:hypothetical protein
MATNKRFFSPGILNKLDNWLLLNKPETWSARTHLVIYYGGLFILALAAICFAFPDDPRSATGVANWALFTSIITLLAFVVWLIYLLRFNVFKRYGNTNALSRLQTFVLYFIASGFIMLIPFTEPAVETVKANMAYGGEEVVRDINNINVKVNQIEYDSLDNNWSRDTFRIVDTLEGHSRLSSDEDVVTTDYAIVTPKGKFKVIDTAELQKKLRYADSTEKIDDSTYIFLSCPDYTWINQSSADTYTNKLLLTDRDIYDSIVVNYQKPSQQVYTELGTLISKYKYPHPEYYYEDRTVSPTYVANIPTKYSLNSVDHSFSNLLERKYRWCGTEGNILFRIFFYITLAMTLLIFVFRHSTVKTFFFTLLAGIVITILSALILAFGRYNGGSAFFKLLLFYCFIFILVSMATFSSTKRSVVTGIALNLFVFVLPFMPLLITGLYNTMLEEKYRLIPYPHPQPEYWNLIYAEVLGPVIFLVLVPLYTHKVYRKWYALPEN